MAKTSPKSSGYAILPVFSRWKRMDSVLGLRSRKWNTLPSLDHPDHFRNGAFKVKKHVKRPIATHHVHAFVRKRQCVGRANARLPHSMVQQMLFPIQLNPLSTVLLRPISV